ncbi:hypothetical protein Ahy_B04g072013 [Arachis hypogaea]|uniref:Uncharacterized protein n=1 Tax=Arachis hypogaea TaxID=3818 RepID=A0A444ZM91_ARAHY|nr:hypothetical protein Ahy_B04g072013 [Arachis hypogaea]
MFNCSFEWQGACHMFDAYNKARDLQNCYWNCNYNVKQFGPCKVYSSKNIKCFSWNNMETRTRNLLIEYEETMPRYVTRTHDLLIEYGESMPFEP